MTRPTTHYSAELSRVLRIAEQGEKYVAAVRLVKLAQQQLSDAYANWKHEAGIDYHLTPDTSAWAEMMAATDSEYRQLQSAKSRERRCKANLLVCVTEGAA